MEGLIKELEKDKNFIGKDIKSLALLIVLQHALDLQKEVFKKKLSLANTEPEIDFQYGDFLRNDSMIQKILDIYK